MTKFADVLLHTRQGQPLQALVDNDLVSFHEPDDEEGDALLTMSPADALRAALEALGFTVEDV